MADPLSVAGLAAGVVSLGLQVASGITSYLDAIKGRQEEVASVKRELDSITSTLQRLDSICSQTQAQHPASTILRQSIEACRIELDNLGNIPACIQSLNPQQGPSSSTQNVDARLFKKLMETQEHLAYPLRHAAKVQKLASQLRNLRESLQTSLQEVTIELSLSMAQSATEVQVDVALTRKEMQEVSLSTRVIQDAVTGFESNIAYIQTMIQGLLQSHHDSQAQQLQAYLAQVQELVQGPTAECRTQERSLLSPSTHDDHTDSVLGRRITRAGATSIAPIIKCQTVVDHTRTPAFRLVSLLNRWFELMESVHIREPGLLHASEIKHDKGSPTNVDYLHQSLAHHLVTVMNNMGIFGFCYNFTKKLKFGLPNSDRTLLLDYDQFLRTFLDFLLSLRIPLITYDVDGRTPLSEILEYPSDDGVRVIVDTLSSEGNEVLPFFRFQGPRESLQASHKTMSWRLANIPVLAEACEVNPLCKAAYAGDEQGVTYLLSRNPAYIEDEIIALQSLEILLEAGCMHEFGFLYVPSEHSSDYASDAVVAYANNLVWRRKELKQIARLYIAEARHGDLGLNSRAVLDANVSEVVKTLQEMGICLDPKLYRSTTNRDGESIFHRITTPKVADLFYSLGFRDLSACTEIEESAQRPAESSDL
ncbi:hypothetical protein PGQ11_010645 [Apiospora arundinis]|uniref:Fungal N-terminal domain-containing protein n=1 Tax=Apiospora arundinis TaxID=335852 RepID=A0ABR2IAE6_9PEZI